MIRILIAGAGGSAAANFIRSLRESSEKFFIIGVDTNKYHLQASDVDRAYIVPESSKKNYIAALNKIIKKEKIVAFYPQSDAEVLIASRNSKKIHALTFLPPYKVVKNCQNKNLLIKRLMRIGVPVPETIGLENEEEIDKFLKKYKRIWLRATQGAGSKAALPVSNKIQINGWLDYWGKRGISKRKFMLSEFLPGKEYAFQSIWKEGILITSQARERVEYLFGSIMPSGQSSTPSIAKTVHKKSVNEIACKAILAIDPNPNGIYSVDLKENKKNTPCVTEINAGRFFTTSYFYTAAGVNMPYQYMQLLLGKKIKAQQYNAVNKDLYWVRIIDSPGTLISKNSWKIKKI